MHLGGVTVTRITSPLARSTTVDDGQVYHSRWRLYRQYRILRVEHRWLHADLTSKSMIL